MASVIDDATALAHRDTPHLDTMRRRDDERVNWRSSTPFLLVHATPLLLLWTGISATAVVLVLVTFWARMFFITAGYHRYFAHRSYRMRRVTRTTSPLLLSAWKRMPSRVHCLLRIGSGLGPVPRGTTARRWC